MGLKEYYNEARYEYGPIESIMCALGDAMDDRLQYGSLSDDVIGFVEGMGGVFVTFVAMAEMGIQKLTGKSFAKQSNI